MGLDSRQPLAYFVAQSSMIRRASRPLMITPLMIHQLPITRMGLTEFTYTRYLVPWLCNYEGRAVFVDPDIILNGDICELYDTEFYGALACPKVQNPRRNFERPAVMVFNCEQCKILTPEWIESKENHPNSLQWADSIHPIQPDWNHLVGYDDPAPARLVHFTCGIPHQGPGQPPAVAACEYAAAWQEEANEMMKTVSWKVLMGPSVHRKVVGA